MIPLFPLSALISSPGLTSCHCIGIPDRFGHRKLNLNARFAAKSAYPRHCTGRCRSVSSKMTALYLCPFTRSYSNAHKKHRWILKIHVSLHACYVTTYHLESVLGDMLHNRHCCAGDPAWHLGQHRRQLWLRNIPTMAIRLWSPKYRWRTDMSGLLSIDLDPTPAKPKRPPGTADRSLLQCSWSLLWRVAINMQSAMLLKRGV
jgi:hypothetical protein